MTDSWDEVLDWERWAKEVLTDWRVPFDNHKVGLRLGITQQLCDLRDERDALAARLAEAERLILRMSGEGFIRAKFYVEKYDLTGERAADSASAVQPERCCVDYPRCDCNSPPEPDDDWLCFQRPAQPKVTP